MSSPGRIARLHRGSPGRHYSWPKRTTGQPALSGFSRQPQAGRAVGRAGSSAPGFLPIRRPHSRSCNTAGDPGDFANPQNALVLAWNQYRIEVQGDVITANRNGVDTCRYTIPDPNRGRFSAAELPSLGFRHIRIMRILLRSET